MEIILKNTEQSLAYNKSYIIDIISIIIANIAIAAISAATTTTAAFSVVVSVMVMNFLVSVIADLPLVVPTATTIVRTNISAGSCCYCYQCSLLTAITIGIVCECV